MQASRFIKISPEIYLTIWGPVLYCRSVTAVANDLIFVEPDGKWHSFYLQSGASIQRRVSVEVRFRIVHNRSAAILHYGFWSEEPLPQAPNEWLKLESTKGEKKGEFFVKYEEGKLLDPTDWKTNSKNTLKKIWSVGQVRIFIKVSKRTRKRIIKMSVFGNNGEWSGSFEDYFNNSAR